MLEKYIPKHVANALIKHVVAVTLLIPYYYSHNYNIYYQDFILATFFAAFFMVTVFTSWKLDYRRNGVLVCILSVLLVAYNGFATYMNYNYHHWYGDQINTTLAFLFFIVLLLVKDAQELIDENVIKATIHLIVASNILALMYRALDKYAYLFFFNTEIRQGKFRQDEKQFSWLYAHKSQYALLLVLCVAFFVVHRKHFRNKLTYCLSQGVLLVALYFTTSYTSMVAALIIFAGQFMDYWRKAKWKGKIILSITTIVPLCTTGILLFQEINEKRSLWSLGNRIYIWETFIELIEQNPNGIGKTFDTTLYLVPHIVQTNNCHNVFLNHIFRFSIQVGMIYSIIFLIILYFSIKRNFSLLTLSIWIAILIPMTMDYALLTSELPFVLFILFCLFFRDHKIVNSSLK